MSVLSVLSTAAGAALASGVVAAMVTHFLTSDRERRSVLRQKAEDLYVSAEAWENSWSLTLISLRAAVKGRIDYNQHLDALISLGEKTDGSLNRRVHMLTQIYLPSAEPNLLNVLSALSDFNTLVDSHKEAYRQGEFDVFNWNRDFAPLVEAVSENFKAYRASVVRCAQSSFTPLKKL